MKLNSSPALTAAAFSLTSAAALMISAQSVAAAQQKKAAGAVWSVLSEKRAESESAAGSEKRAESESAAGYERADGYASAAGSETAAISEPPAGSENTAYPSNAVFNAFREGCGAIKSQAATSTNLISKGWTVVDDVAVTPLREISSLARSAMQRANLNQAGSMSELEVFTRTISGEKLYITLSEVSLDQLRITGCRLFDPEESRSIPVETVAKWLAREPIRSKNLDAIQVATWEPGIIPAHDSFQLFFIPEDSPFKDRLKFSGISFKSDTVVKGD